MFKHCAYFTSCLKVIPKCPHCLKITQNVAFEFLNFDIFHQFLVQLKLTCLVTLVLTRFARNDEWDFFCDFQTLWNGSGSRASFTFSIPFSMTSRVEICWTYIWYLTWLVFAKFDDVLRLIRNVVWMFAMQMRWLDYVNHLSVWVLFSPFLWHDFSVKTTSSHPTLFENF